MKKLVLRAARTASFTFLALGLALAPSLARAEGIPLESFIKFVLIESAPGARITEALTGSEVHSLRDLNRFDSVLGRGSNEEFRRSFLARAEDARVDFMRRLRASDRPLFSLGGVDTQLGAVLNRHLQLEDTARLVFVEAPVAAGSYGDSVSRFLDAGRPRTAKLLTDALAAGDSLAGYNLQAIDVAGLSLVPEDATRPGLELTETNLDFANFTRAKLPRASFNRRSQLDFAVFRGADLRGARFGEAGAWGADFRGADLRSADLRRADLYYPDLSHADLSDARLDGALLGDADLRGARFLRASLKGVHFYDEHSGTMLDGADFTGADLEGVSFAGLDLRQVTLDGANLRDAIFTTETKLPFTREAALSRGMIFRP